MRHAIAMGFQRVGLLVLPLCILYHENSIVIYMSVMYSIWRGIKHLLRELILNKFIIYNRWHSWWRKYIYMSVSEWMSACVCACQWNACEQTNQPKKLTNVAKLIYIAKSRLTDDTKLVRIPLETFNHHHLDMTQISRHDPNINTSLTLLRW